jgi:hypothetical protein
MIFSVSVLWLRVAGYLLLVLVLLSLLLWRLSPPLPSFAALTSPAHLP